MKMKHIIAVFTLALSLAGFATVTRITPAGDLATAVNALNPGDTLIAGGGVYRVPTLSITKQGSANAWIVVRAADGEQPVIRGTSPTHNLIALRGAAFLVLDGFEVDSVPPDVMPVRFEKNYGNSHHVVIRNFHIHHVPSIAIDAKGDHYDITIQGCHIHHTSDGTAEGMYIGNHDGADHPHHWIIEGNWIHHCGYLNSSQGDGIELKYGCYAMTVRNNVVYSCNYPGILYYGYNGDNSDGSKTCLIEGNAVWDEGEAIGCYADAVVRNNIVFNADMAVYSALYSGHKTPENVEIYNNTFYDFQSVTLSSWDAAKTCVFANNAAFKTAAGNVISLSGTGDIHGNVGSAAQAGVTQANAADALLDPGASDFYPKSGSALVNSATGTHRAARDFNGTLRDAQPDVGAYEWTGPANPGWSITAGFKSGGPADTLDLSRPVPFAPQTLHMDLFPNPARQRLHIILPPGLVFPVEIGIYREDGRLVRSFRLERAAGHFQFQWPESMAAGRYLAFVKAGGSPGQGRLAAVFSVVR